MCDTNTMFVLIVFNWVIYCSTYLSGLGWYWSW